RISSSSAPASSICSGRGPAPASDMARCRPDGTAVSGPILAARQVTKIFPTGRGRRVVALQDVTLGVEEGELVCLVGSSGCGKSTFLYMLAGFVPPTSGQILLHGEPVVGIEPRCGIVFQSYALFPWKTVHGNVE